MAQYGRALVALGRGMVVAETPAAMHAARRAGQVPVWSPMAMLRGAAVATSWAVTSDSLALLLAARLGAARAVLVKHRAAAEAADPAALVTEGLVDAAFPAFRAAFPGDVRIVGPADFAALA